MKLCPACNKKLNKEFVDGVYIMSCECGFVNKSSLNSDRIHLYS